MLMLAPVSRYPRDMARRPGEDPRNIAMGHTDAITAVAGP
eukprot:CAMPEP_0179318640 /NCGR_PEP_ID=MMETSP0797-20121207/57013_1 /TAXON_ID=47934 /ORGANISM="Dinophysis acuminata, Strain DAEP01" /LENGTH=39 /DNA_ID= /DNA_START= /DNA_END= /DNA_ORIENTATION=